MIPIHKIPFLLAPAIIASPRLAAAIRVPFVMSLLCGLPKFARALRAALNESLRASLGAGSAHRFTTWRNVTLLDRVAVAAQGWLRRRVERPLNASVAMFVATMARATGQTYASAMLTKSHIVAGQRVSPLAMSLRGVHAPSVFATGDELKMNRIAACPAAAQMIKRVLFQISRQRMDGPGEHQTMKSDFWPMKPSATVAVVIESAGPNPTRRAVPRDIGCDGYFGKEPGEIFSTDWADGKIRVRHGRSILSPVFRAVRDVARVPCGSFCWGQL